jgi:uncharacterized membrane protein YraQ (UPF0718 family)
VGTWVVAYLYVESFSKWFAFHLLPLKPKTSVGDAVQFFVFEAPKVMLLLVGVIFIVGIIRSFFSAEKTRRLLTGKRQFTGNVLAATLGIVTPFCSCSAVPLFIGFVESGVPLGVTLSFLIAAPMINEIAIVLLFGLFGFQITAIYIVTGLLIAIFAGWTIGKLGMEKHVEPWVYEMQAAQAEEIGSLSWHDRFAFARTAIKDIVAKVWPFVLAGIAVGAWIHGAVPVDALSGIMGKGAWWSVPLAVVLGVPMYSNAAGIIPIVQALLEKGASLGTVLAFMMSVIGLSLPEVIILRKVLRPRLIATFVGVVSLGILCVGFLFNAIL